MDIIKFKFFRVPCVLNATVKPQKRSKTLSHQMTLKTPKTFVCGARVVPCCWWGGDFVGLKEFALRSKAKLSIRWLVRMDDPWSEWCTEAESRSLERLLNANYISGSILVSG